MLSSGTWPHRPFRDVTARPCRQTSLTRTNKPKITNYSCRICVARKVTALAVGVGLLELGELKCVRELVELCR